MYFRAKNGTNGHLSLTPLLFTCAWRSEEEEEARGRIFLSAVLFSPPPAFYVFPSSPAPAREREKKFVLSSSVYVSLRWE